MAIDLDKSDGEEDEDLDRFDINMDDGRSKVRFKRIYDAKYKIPTSSNKVVENLNIANLFKNSNKIQRRLTAYKRTSNIVTTFLMGLSGICMIVLYIYQYIKLVERPYYVTRA